MINRNFENAIDFLKINKYGFYPPIKTTEEMYYYMKDKGLNISYEKMDSGFYKFKLNKEGD